MHSDSNSALRMEKDFQLKSLADAFYWLDRASAIKKEYVEFIN